MMIRRRPPLFAMAVGVVAVCAALWLVALTHKGGGSTSLDARVAAVGATVRCPICPEGIPLNDIANPAADQMRGLIRDELRQGLSEDGVRQSLVDTYGASILLAPPQRGFDALAWFVPLLVVAGCAVALLFYVRGWVRPAAFAPAGIPTGPPGPRPDPKEPWKGTDPEGSSDDGGDEGRRYEELLDRELQLRG